MKAILVKPEKSNKICKGNSNISDYSSSPNIDFDVSDKWNENESNDWNVNESEDISNGQKTNN
ncbi:MAG: hypothetical protein Q4E74_09055 [Ruminococcus sp.]|nr:hypothetical protein [Ruminococcus sp.]